MKYTVMQTQINNWKNQGETTLESVMARRPTDITGSECCNSTSEDIIVMKNLQELGYPTELMATKMRAD